MVFDSVSEALAEIIGKNGKDILLDGRRCLAQLKDLAPKQQDDIALLRHAFDGGYTKALVSASDEDEQQLAVNGLYSALKDKVRLSEDAANDACMIFIEALGWNTDTPYNRPRSAKPKPVAAAPGVKPSAAPRVLPSYYPSSYNKRKKTFREKLADLWDYLDGLEKFCVILLGLIGLVTVFDLIGGIFFYEAIGSFVYKVSIGTVIAMIVMLVILLKFDSSVDDLPDFFWPIYALLGIINIIYMIVMIVKYITHSE